MKPPLFVRPLAEAERAALRHGLRSPDAFTLRRCQVLLASDQGHRPSRIAAALGCGVQTVRDALRAFAAEGLAGLHQKPKVPKTIHTAWPRDRDDDLRALLHQSPRVFGKPTSLWTLPLAGLGLVSRDETEGAAPFYDKVLPPAMPVLTSKPWDPWN